MSLTKLSNAISYLEVEQSHEIVCNLHKNEKKLKQIIYQINQKNDELKYLNEEILQRKKEAANLFI